MLWHALAQKHFAVLQALALGESAIDWTPETDDHTLPDLAGMERSRVCADAFRSLYLCLGVRPFCGIYSRGRCEPFDPSSEIRSGYFSVFRLHYIKDPCLHSPTVPTFAQTCVYPWYSSVIVFVVHV